MPKQLTPWRAPRRFECSGILVQLRGCVTVRTSDRRAAATGCAGRRGRSPIVRGEPRGGIHGGQYGDDIETHLHHGLPVDGRSGRRPHRPGADHGSDAALDRGSIVPVARPAYFRDRTVWRAPTPPWAISIRRSICSQPQPPGVARSIEHGSNTTPLLPGSATLPASRHSSSTDVRFDVARAAPVNRSVQICPLFHVAGDRDSASPRSRQWRRAASSRRYRFASTGLPVASKNSLRCSSTSRVSGESCAASVR
jgi:hypothetical protein